MKIFLFSLKILFAESDFSQFYRQILVAQSPSKITLKNSSSIEKFLDFERNRLHRRELVAMVANFAQGAGSYNNAHGLSLNEYQTPKAFKPCKKPKNKGKMAFRRRQYFKHFLHW